MSKFQGIILVLAGLAAVGIATSFAEGYARELLIFEGGFVETVSAIGYFVCALYMVRCGGPAFLKRYIYAFIILLLMGIRELGLHAWIFFPGAFRSRFYFDPDNLLIDKLVGAAIIFMLLYLIYQVVFHLVAPLIKGVLELDRSAVAMGVAVVLLALAMVSDGIKRKLAWFDIVVTLETEKKILVFEEVVEMGIPMMIFLGLYYYFADYRARQDRLAVSESWDKTRG